MTRWQRLARTVVCLAALAGGGMPVLAGEADEAKLGAIRAALVDAALDARTQVRVTQWMDSRGALQQYNRFSSEIRLRDLRLASQTVRDASPKAVAQLAAQAEPVTAGGCASPAARSRLRHMVSSHMALSGDLMPAQRFLAQQGGRLALEALIAVAADQPHWRLVPGMELTRAYERRLQGYGAELLPWQIELRVEALGVDATDHEQPHLALHWRLRNRLNGAVWLQRRDMLPPPSTSLNATTPRADATMLQAITRSVRGFAAEVDRRFSCEPQPLPLVVQDGQLTVQAGALAGLKVGDRVLLADARHLPQHVLEPSSLDAAVLAEVKSVTAFAADLQQVAGPKQRLSDAWVVWPYTY